MSRTRWLLFSALLIGSAGFFQPVEYENTKSRWMLLRSIVDEGRLNIDSYQQYTTDKLIFGGHYYSDKAIGLPLLAAPLYWVLRHSLFSQEESLSVATILADPRPRYLIRVAIVSLPFALMGLLILDLLILMAVPARRALWSVLAYGFGTIALSNAALFSGHQTAAFFSFLSFFLLYRSAHENKNRDQALVVGFLAGLCAGLGVLCDYIAVFAAVPLTVYALTSRVDRRAKIAFVCGAALCAGVLGAYNQACFGSPLSLSYAHLKTTPNDLTAEHGDMIFGRPRLFIFLLLMGSASKGLLFISPVLVYAIIGFSLLRRRADLRREFNLLCVVTAMTILVLSGFDGWHGGACFGPRYLVANLPFFSLPLAFAADGGPWFLLLFGLSVFEVGCVQLGCPHLHGDIYNPIPEFVMPLMSQGVVAYTWLGKTGIVGHLTGGILEYGILAALAALAFNGLPKIERTKLSRGWKWFMGSLALCIIVTLCLFRPASSNVVRWRRAQAMHEYASAILSPEMERKARLEMSPDRAPDGSPGITDTTSKVFPEVSP